MRQGARNVLFDAVETSIGKNRDDFYYNVRWYQADIIFRMGVRDTGALLDGETFVSAVDSSSGYDS